VVKEEVVGLVAVEVVVKVVDRLAGVL